MEQQLEESSSPSSSSVELVQIPIEGIDRIWGIAAPLLEKATKRTRKIDLGSLRGSLELGEMQLWLGFDTEDESIPAAVVTQLSEYTSGLKAAQIILLGGLHLNRWRSVIATIEGWAFTEGCETVEIVGRRGWGRVYPDYAPQEYWFSKEIR